MVGYLCSKLDALGWESDVEAMATRSFFEFSALRNDPKPLIQQQHLIWQNQYITYPITSSVLLNGEFIELYISGKTCLSSIKHGVLENPFNIT